MNYRTFSSSPAKVNGRRQRMTTDAADGEPLLPDADDVTVMGGSPGPPRCQGNLQSTSTTCPDSGTVTSWRVYRRRWYCLLVYTSLGFVYSLSVVTLSPIAHALYDAFGWRGGEFAIVNSWPYIVFIISIGFCTWLLDTRGLRVACLFGAVAMCLGTGVRCITSTPPGIIWTFNAGQILIGLAGPSVFAGLTTFSNTWFPPKQRVTATGLAQMGLLAGTGTGGLIGPYMVQIPEMPNNNSSVSTTTSIPFTNVTDLPGYVAHIRDKLMLCMYIEFGVSLFVLVATLIYFPAKPPTPPSLSATSERLSVVQGLGTVCGRSQLWFLALGYSLGSGVLGGFMSAMDVNLGLAGVPDDQLVTGWLNLAGICSGMLATILFSRIADRFWRYAKYMMQISFAAAAASFLWFTLIIEGILSPSLVCLFISCTVGSFFIQGCTPLFLEMACDAAFPLSEGLANGLIICFNFATIALFLLILLIPNIGTSWINWVLVGSTVLCIPLLVPVRTSGGRAGSDSAADGGDSTGSVGDASPAPSEFM